MVCSSSTVGIYCIAFLLFFMASLIYPMLGTLSRPAIHFEPSFSNCYYGALWQGFQETSWGRSQIRDYQAEVAPRYEPR